MNIQEGDKLTGFLRQLAQAQAGAKDVEAERLILESSGRQPDALYLLVQRCLLLDHALENAQAEIVLLKRERDTPRQADSSFLRNNAWGAAVAPAASAAPVPGYAAAGQAPAAPASSSSWGSAMLGSIATTAAGVVAGGFLFQGIEHLMGHNRGGSSSLSAGHDSQADSMLPLDHVASNHFDDSSNAASDYIDSSGLDAIDP